MHLLLKRGDQKKADLRDSKGETPVDVYVFTPELYGFLFCSELICSALSHGAIGSLAVLKGEK